MTKVSCNAKTCGYNDNEYCTKKGIDVEGLFAKSKIGTFCQSFKNPHGNEELRMEMANEISPESKIQVTCSANYCRYNQENLCHKDEILIGNDKAQYRSETQCDSFKLKQE
ncbi:MAG: DUF1540 domain-containing protein [Acholeplasmatales bacterium]|nr:DUF1540 domain-containing protein [Acholeplasmatales bacterium]